MRALIKKIRQLLKDRRFRKIWYRGISATAAVVVFITTYALVLPAITMETEAKCGIPAHQHTTECYEEQLICGLEESDGHHHTDDCYTVTKELTCETPEHKHDESCFDEDGNLTCSQDEHSHSDTCYEEHRELTCGLEESEGHHHDSSCYKQVLTCGLEAHIHSTECYKEDSKAVTASTSAPASEDSATAVAATAASTSVPVEIDDSDKSSAPSDTFSDTSDISLDAADNSGKLDITDATDTTNIVDTSEEGSAEDMTDNGNADQTTASDETSPASLASDSDESNAESENASIAATTDVLPEPVEQETLSEGYVPTLDPVNMDQVLDRQTGFYYYHAEEGEDLPASSAEITSWKKVEDNTELAPADLVKAYFAYTIPAGTLNETNQVARYRLPANLHLTDDQIMAINQHENGISASYIDYDTLEILDSDNYHKYLGAEAIDGTRTPDQTLVEGTQEYISAVVKAENVYENTLDADGNYVTPDGAAADGPGTYLGQELIFIFTPYTIEKNQITYDAKGNPTAAGEKVSGWFTCDFNLEQIDWSDSVETILSSDSEDLTVAAESQKQDQNQEQEKEQNQAQEQESVQEQNEADANIQRQDNAEEITHTVPQRIERTAHIVFVTEGRDENNHEILEISTDLKLVEVNEIEIDNENQQTAVDKEEQIESPEANVTVDSSDENSEAAPEDTLDSAESANSAEDGVNAVDHSAPKENNEKPAEKAVPEYKDGTLEANGSGYKITMDYKADAKIPENAYLHVTEITKESDAEAYEACLEEARKSVPSDSTRVDDKASRFFDIEILVNEFTSQNVDDEERQQINEKDIEKEKTEPESIDSEKADSESIEVAESNSEVAENGDSGIEDTESEATQDKGTVTDEKEFENTEEVPATDNEETAEVAETSRSESGFAKESVEEQIITRKIEPAAPVSVNIQLFDTEISQKADEFNAEQYKVVHIAEDGTEEIQDVKAQTIESEKKESEPGSAIKGSDPDVTAVVPATEVKFEAESFSIYGVVYTVDFEYSVNGKMYQFTLPGGGFVSFTDLVEVLGIIDSTNTSDSASEDNENDVQSAPLSLDGVVVSNETKEFVTNVANVEFSKPELLSVSKVEEDTTVGTIKDVLHLECEYSAELTEEQIDQINNTEVETGDWALVTLKAFDTEETLTITMTDGEVFTIKVTDARDPLGLDGQTYAILTNKVSNGSTTTHTLQANVHTSRDTRGYYLESKTINKNDGTQYALNSYDGLEYVASDVTAWTFEYDEDAEAYYISYNGKYLYIDPNIESKNASQDHSLNLVDTKTVADGGTLITITKENGNYYLGNAKGTMLWDYGNGYWLSNENDPAETDSKENNAAVHLCMPENPTENASHKATMISIQDTQPGQRLIIYQRVLQPDNTYKEYAINGDGQLVEVFPSSDSVYWKGNQSIEWEMADLGNGYYTLKNTVTGAYLSPKGGQTPSIVHQDSDYTSNPDELRVTLPDKGAKGNPYTSLISCWDFTNNVTEGLKVTRDGNSATLSSVLSDDAQKFYFASRDPIVTGQLTTVKTVDNNDHGIKMTMFDFTSNSYPNARVPYQTYVMGGESWGEGVLNQGIMGRTLYTGKTGWNGNHYYINGFPNSNRTGRSYGLVFQDDDVGSYNYSIRSEKEANHLFVQSVYDSTGYFHYSSFENFARFNETTGNFTVYDQIGTPACLNDDWNAAYQNRGNFMPYNDLNVASSKSHTYNGQTVYGNWYQSGNSDPLPDDDPRKGERLYQMEGVTDHSNTSYNKLDYFFGMIMEAKFMQGEDGLTDRGDPMRYEFNGDDDLYVYVDNVLLLDIGGVHDAFRGYIDFSTGDIEVYPATKQSANMFLGSKTTIKRQYWEAGQFPNGDPWDHNVYPYDCDKANEFFDGETFRDYSTHDFKMFYMERGAGASNLQIDFNLMTLTDSQFRVKKEMPETQNGGEIQQDYTDAAFYYEAWVKGENDSDYQKVTRTYLEGLNTQQDKTPRYQDGTPVEWKTDDPNETKFVVRPGQTAVFPAVDDSVRWYVKEVEPESNSQMLSYYQVSNSDQDISDPTGSTSNKDLIKNRNIVIYQNRPNDDLVNELRITKKVIGTPYNADDKFEYRILLEDTNGNMGPYKEGPYYQLDKDGNYVYFEQGERKTQTMPRVAEKTSINGSVNNILDGDTIIIKGLLEGTDFYVYERTDTSYGNIALNATPVENKYVFVGTDMTGAFNRRTDDPQTYDFGHSVGHLFDAPSGLDGMIENYGISEYEQSLAARGAILKDSDTDVTVKNKPYHPIDITVEKKWPADSADFDMDSDLDNAATTFTLKRYKLDARHGTVNLTGILNRPPHTGADPVYHFRKDGQLIKSIAYSDLVKDANDPNKGTLKVTDLPIGDYVITTDDYIVGYDISHEVTPTDTISVTEGSETDVTVTTHYGRQYGTMTIRKTLSGNYASHQNDRFIYTVHGPDGFSFTAEKYARDAENGVITIDVMNDGVPDLPSGDYVVSEAVVNSDTSGQGLSGNHTPSSQSVYVNDHQRAYADFTGDYANPLIPVTIHVGHDQGGFYEDKSSVYYLPVGKTVTVTTSVKLCPHYREGVYAYGPTSACTAGVLSDTFDASNTDWVSRTFTFSIPENVTSYNYYIKTKCNQASWDPTIISAVSSNQNRLMMGAARRSAASAGPAKAGTSGGSIYNSVTDNSLPTLTAEEQAKEKFVIDDSWTMTVVLTKDDYKAYLGNDTTTTPVVTGDTTTGTSFWDALLSHESIVSEDENGNLYYYYIDSFKEDGITQRMEPSFDMDPDDSTKTLMTSRDKKQKLSVSNELITNGSLTITKEVTVNGQEVTDHTGPSPADGIYTFKLTKKNDNSFAERTITLTIENGVTVTSTAITDLKAGEYTVTEQTPTNGTTLTKIDGVSVSTSGGDVTVTAGETANIRFTNNIGQTEITVKKVDAEKAANAEDRFLANAKFSLLDSDGHTVSGIQTIKITDLNTGSDIIPDANNEFTIPITGIKIAGLPDGSYRLVEKKAPDGYIITNPVTTFTVSQGVVTAWSLTGTAGTAFEIPNPPGTELPMTGGSGTGLFTILGSILITGAGLLLWRRRRLI